MPARQGHAADRLVFEQQGQTHEIEGKVIVTAADGGKLLLAPDGAVWAVEPDQLQSHEKTAAPFEPLDADQLEAQLRSNLPAGFEVHRTARYMICYNTSRAYAQWCGALFERLYRAFHNFWQRRGLELHPPEFPLVAVVFDSQQSYEKYSRGELGDAVDSIVGYYSLRTNRISMYDLTGVQALRRAGSRRSSADEISQMLSQPQASPLVATIIHEATHQIAFNCGLQTRYSDVPLWLSEGIAMYFETPDLGSSKGWRGIGAVNRPRLLTFRKHHRSLNSQALAGLIASDRRLRDPRTAPRAYAEAWSLTYYLIRRHEDDFIAYLKTISEKNRLVWDDPETRLAEFTKHFGEMDALSSEFKRQMMSVR